MNNRIKYAIVGLSFLVGFGTVFGIGKAVRNMEQPDINMQSESHAPPAKTDVSETVQQSAENKKEPSKAETPDKEKASSQPEKTESQVSVEEEESEISQQSVEESSDGEEQSSSDESQSSQEDQESEVSKEETNDDKSFTEHIEAARMAGAGIDDYYRIHKQIMIVKSSDTSAEISLYEQDENGSFKNTGISAGGYVGFEGVGTANENSSKSPMGIHNIGEAFYQNSKPDTKLDSFKINPDTIWVSDVNSPYYNQVINADSKYKASTDDGFEPEYNDNNEYMANIGGYSYGFVIEYNTDARKVGEGSAFFFHVGNGPTAGCVATDESSVLSYLSKLDKSKHPAILIY